MLKVALIVDSKHTSKYVYDLAKWGREQPKISITHIIIQANTKSERWQLNQALYSLGRVSVADLINQAGWVILQKIDSLTLKSKKHYKKHYRTFDLSDLNLHQIKTHPTVSDNGFSYLYEKGDIDEIKKSNADILINCSHNIIKDEIFNAAKLGVISCYHADNSIIRGGPPGFWEVYNREASTGFIIQKLNKSPGTEQVLFKGSVPTKYSYSLNQAALYQKSIFFLKRLLEEIAEKRSFPAALPVRPYYNQRYSRPNILVQLRYFLRLMSTIFVNKLRKFVLKKDLRWSVAFQEGRDWKSIVMCRANIIPNPPNHFLADPFVIKVGERVCCFVEDYNYEIQRGCISTYELKGDEQTRIGEVIIEPFHMSFPYLFKFKDKLYMCPETCENRDIRIYECVEFPTQWRFVMSIMTDVAAVDSMIFFRDGSWWLMTNIDSANIGDYCSELHIFSSCTPLTKQWTPHSKNPVLFDSRFARNGGLLRNKKDFYRVYQTQGFDMYGKSSGIKRIVSLSQDDYIEKEFASIEPNFFSGIEGTHHFYHNDGFVVFDFVKMDTLK